MKMRTRIASVVCAVAMTFGMGAAAFAQATEEADVEVEVEAVTGGGALTPTLSVTTGFEIATYSNTDQTTTGELTLTVTDTRGTAPGWTVYLHAEGDFKGEIVTNSGDIPLEGFSITPGTVSRVSGQATLPTGSTFGTVTTASKQILSASAGAGAGSYKMLLPASVLVPGGTLVDTYTTTLIVSDTSTP